MDRLDYTTGGAPHEFDIKVRHLWFRETIFWSLWRAAGNVGDGLLHSLYLECEQLLNERFGSRVAEHYCKVHHVAMGKQVLSRRGRT